jgi:hypothetical protein
MSFGRGLAVHCHEAMRAPAGFFPGLYASRIVALEYPSLEVLFANRATQSCDLPLFISKDIACCVGRRSHRRVA